MKFEDVIQEVKQLMPHEQEFIMNMVADKRHIKLVEWIPMSNPPALAGYSESKIYLIWRGHLDMAYWYNGLWTDEIIGPYLTYKDVTHWMSLPKAPD